MQLLLAATGSSSAKGGNGINSESSSGFVPDPRPCASEGRGYRPAQAGAGECAGGSAPASTVKVGTGTSTPQILPLPLLTAASATPGVTNFCVRKGFEPFRSAKPVEAHSRRGGRAAAAISLSFSHPKENDDEPPSSFFYSFLLFSRAAFWSQSNVFAGTLLQGKATSLRVIHSRGPKQRFCGC